MLKVSIVTTEIGGMNSSGHQIIHTHILLALIALEEVYSKVSGLDLLQRITNKVRLPDGVPGCSVNN